MVVGAIKAGDVRWWYYEGYCFGQCDILRDYYPDQENSPRYEIKCRDTGYSTVTWAENLLSDEEHAAQLLVT